MSLMELNDVYKWVGNGALRTEILRGVTLHLEKGEFLAIIGPSGSGKSTLLNLMGLLDVPSQGSVLWNGENVSRFSSDELSMLRSQSIGFIFQMFNLLPYLTARQNVALPASYRRIKVTQDDTDRLLDRVRLSHRLEAYPPTLSGGEKQRVAIARALANSPALLLADEPTGALDTATGEEILDLLLDLHAKGATLALITHNEEIAKRAQRVLVMRDGRLS